MSLSPTFLLAVYGVTLIVTVSKLFAPLRALFLRLTGSHFLHCPMCVGFWISNAIVLCRTTDVRIPVDAHPATWILYLLIFGGAGSGFCWIVHVILVRLGQDLL
jgi:hypothetical protein